MLASALADPGRFPELLALMVSLHRRIHATAAPRSLPDLKQRLAARIAPAERPDRAPLVAAARLSENGRAEFDRLTQLAQAGALG